MITRGLILSDFLYSFIPIFVAIDIGGLMPVFTFLSPGSSPRSRKGKCNGMPR